MYLKFMTYKYLQSKKSKTDDKVTLFMISKVPRKNNNFSTNHAFFTVKLPVESKFVTSKAKFNHSEDQNHEKLRPN